MFQFEYDPSHPSLGRSSNHGRKQPSTIIQNPQGLNSRETWQKVNQRLDPETISRASIINFLEDMRQMQILTGDDKTGKGGYHWIHKLVNVA